MIEAMTEDDELAQLRERVDALEIVVSSLIVANMKLINANVGLIEANKLRTGYRISNENQDVKEVYFETFDIISEDYDRLNRV